MMLRGADRLAATNARRGAGKSPSNPRRQDGLARMVDVVKSPGRRSERSAKTGEWEDRGGNKQTKKPLNLDLGSAPQTFLLFALCQ